MTIPQTLAGILAAAVMVSIPVVGGLALRAQDSAGCTTDSDCAARFGGDGGPASTILVGVGCGDSDSIMVAKEEDEFPACKRIEAHHVPN